jgi:hypothetical protein
MEVTKETVLESMNTYCTERKYGSETLTDGFKEKFSNFFVKKYEGKDVEEADVIADLHFNLDTAFNASVDINAALKSAFETKENGYKTQIQELNEKLAKKPKPDKTFEIPKELQDKLDKLEKFEDEQRRQDKYKAVLELAKKSVREDLHKSFEKYATDFAVSLDETDEEQAKKLTARFQDIFKDSIGDIKPLAPKQTQKQEEEFFKNVKKVKVC